MSITQVVGIIGGTGQLGSAIARGCLSSGAIAPEALWISSRSGKISGFEAWPGIRFTTSNQELVDAADIVLLSVPPHLFEGLVIAAAGKLVVSVMAGVSIEAIAAGTGAARVIRAMSSPAAELGLAYSPWTAGPGVTAADRDIVSALFEGCGKTDEVPDEAQIAFFTGLTGPVPGLVAYYADCMVRSAVARGVEPRVADRAVRQLFLSSGRILAEAAPSPADQVQAMIDYDGTTAAGLRAMEASPIARSIDAALEAIIDKTGKIAAGG